MKPGRELDALVAERVMGKHWPSNDRYHGRERYWVYYGADSCPDHADARVNDYLPKYSTDIAAAWEVVEKLALTFELGWLPTDEGLNWDASFGEKRGSEEGTTTYADTAPHAICLAALKAVE